MLKGALNNPIRVCEYQIALHWRRIQSSAMGYSAFVMWGGRTLRGTERLPRPPRGKRHAACVGALGPKLRQGDDDTVRSDLCYEWSHDLEIHRCVGARSPAISSLMGSPGCKQH